MKIISRMTQSFVFIPGVICLCSILVSCVNTPTSEVFQENSILENSEPEKLTKEYRNPSMTYEQTSVKLIPYSREISHPRSKISKHQLEIEAANRKRFRDVFKSSEILLTYTCVYNRRGLRSSSSLESVVPNRLYSLINSEFDRRTWSNLNLHLCNHERTTSLRSVDVSVSIVKQ
ncbi:hypothetical protein [Dolichospermum sp. UHCC 0259]|uniref:hypothetical protein n=1 Tax=Dolichospermum sp. UHCC 0259 TaxID=2590010 RepID=UPI00144623EF|nr:hypothetical protein [Dolichospermum sp. UHCC 0259]MTJ51144.1 hypothetical protein [Dolichospermum sp. UHCC 0259]